jgi:molybdopterin converting factor small subunit
MKVIIPTPLRSYTGRREVEASGPTLAAVLADLDRQYPGIRFRVVDEQDRMRPHVRFFVDREAVLDCHPSGPAEIASSRAERLTSIGVSRSSGAPGTRCL